MKHLLKVKNVSKSYPKIETSRGRLKAFWSILFNNKVTDVSEILNDISFEVKKGQSLAIIGKNGAGKSTLLKIISGVIQPSGGSVEMHGTIGAMLELGSGFHPEYSGRENLKMSAALAGLSEKQIKNSLQKMIDFADIGDYIDQPVKNYSSGMVVRLGFSVFTVTKPDLLITDEVLAVGDTQFQRKCIAWLKNYLEEGGTLLLVSHSIYHVQKLCKNAVWLENGKIKMQGGSFAVSQAYQSHYEEVVSSESTGSKTQDVSNYFIKKLEVLNSNKQAIKHLETDDDVFVKVVLHSPDDRPPGLAFGISKGEIPVYGTFSEKFAAKPQRTKAKEYVYFIKLPKIKLLPADYRFQAHCMDPECLRLVHSSELVIRVHSETKDMGLVRLDMDWTHD